MKRNNLALDELVVARDDIPLTPPISLLVEGGQMLAVNGSNGSGKSTLLKTIAGLVPLYRGGITVNGEWPAARNPLYLGHKRGLASGMSVYDNVAFWAQAVGCPELTAAAIHYFDLGDSAGIPVEHLSAGWQQRVALTRLITMQAWLWLLDEPTANLDTQGISLLQSLMQSRLEQGGIILVATHTQMYFNSIKSINISMINNNSKVKS